MKRSARLWTAALLSAFVTDQEKVMQERISPRGACPAAALNGLRAWRQRAGDVLPAEWIQQAKAIFKIAGGKLVRIPPR